MKEEWKDVEGYEGLYQVSNLGRVKSLYNSEQILKPCIDRYGYQYVCFGKNDDGKRLKPKIHRLVGIAFIPNPQSKPQINHRNGLKTDNKKSNLEWSTINENMAHASKNGLLKPQKGSDNNYSKLSENDVLQIRSLHSNGWFNFKELGDSYDVATATISRIVNRKTWTHI